MARLGGSYDVLVVGLGSMGAAAARTLAARGLRVLGLETFGAAHDQGSAHGGTRIVRQSYFEGSAYVPLLRRAYEGWHLLAQESGRDLLRLCGGIYIGDPERPRLHRQPRVSAGARPRARGADAAEIAARFPTMRPPEHALGLYEANAGYVRPEETVLANIDLARRDGADLRFFEPVTHWAPTPGGGVEVVTSRGRYGADGLVLAPGAWVSTLLPPPVPIAVERQIFYWLEPDFTPEVPYEAYAEGPRLPGGDRRQRRALRFPMVDGPAGGLKLGYYRQNHGTTTTPQTIDRTVNADEVDKMVHRARQLFLHVSGRLVRAATCMYASAPDDAFVLGPLGGASQVVLAAASPATGSNSCRWWGRSSPTSSRPGPLRTTSRCSTSRPAWAGRVPPDRPPARLEQCIVGVSRSETEALLPQRTIDGDTVVDGSVAGRYTCSPGRGRAERGQRGMVRRSPPTDRRPKRSRLAGPRPAGVAEPASGPGPSSTGQRPDRPRCSSRRGCPRTM